MLFFGHFSEDSTVGVAESGFFLFIDFLFVGPSFSGSGYLRTNMLTKGSSEIAFCRTIGAGFSVGAEMGLWDAAKKSMVRS